MSVGILAGGRNVRMQKEKATLTYHGDTFIHRILCEMKKYDERIIAGKVTEDYPDVSYLVIADENQGIGPLEGIRQILRIARNPNIFICASDMPFIKEKVVQYLEQFICKDYDCYILCEGEEIHPLCGIYSKTILPQIETMVQNNAYQIRELFEHVRTKYIPIELSCFSPRIVSNINTPKEYEQLQKPFVFCVCGYKNSGKTTLILQLIQLMKEKFPRIGVIKHDGHAFELDREGTDSYRFQVAGALRTGIYDQLQWAMVNKEKVQNERVLIQGMQDMDIIMIEGLKNSTYPKVEILKPGQQVSCIGDVSTRITAVSSCTSQVAQQVMEEVCRYFHIE